jgi:alpha-beta hydrolase superfamily lysophospholipase
MPVHDKPRGGDFAAPQEVPVSRPKMLILAGNSAPAGTYPDEKGILKEWPRGALHESAASDYAKRRGYDAVVLDEPGQPQSQESPPAKAALKKFFL